MSGIPAGAARGGETGRVLEEGGGGHDRGQSAPEIALDDDRVLADLIERLGEDGAFGEAGDAGAERPRTKLMSCSTTTTERVLAISLSRIAEFRTVPASVMPATGSSTSSSFVLGQQHADFQPLLLAVAQVEERSSLRLVRRTVSRISSMRTRSWPDCE